MYEGALWRVNYSLEMTVAAAVEQQRNTLQLPFASRSLAVGCLHGLCNSLPSMLTDYRSQKSLMRREIIPTVKSIHWHWPGNTSWHRLYTGLVKRGLSLVSSQPLAEAWL